MGVKGIRGVLVRRFMRYDEAMGGGWGWILWRRVMHRFLGLSVGACEHYVSVHDDLLLVDTFSSWYNI